MVDLIPPDLKQCQAEITTCNPWVMGGKVYNTVRCGNKPHWLLEEATPGPDGQRGSMTLCDACATVLVEKGEPPPQAYTMDWIAS